MEAYTGFASVYDLFMDNIPYQEWADYICTLLNNYEVTEGILLDLGCGTGNLTELLAGRGYDMIGIDYSEEMLQIAVEKRERSGFDILYLNQDMREFELYGTVNAVISICDSINYILTYDDLVKVFTLVNNYLHPGGVFIFDCNSLYKYEILMGDCVVAEDREDSSFIWDNFFDPATRINEYQLSVFVREEASLYRKYEETHYQRAYSIEEIKAALAAAGLTYLVAYDAFTNHPVTAESERVYIIAREQGKKRYDGNE